MSEGHGGKNEGGTLNGAHPRVASKNHTARFAPLDLESWILDLPGSAGSWFLNLESFPGPCLDGGVLVPTPSVPASFAPRRPLNLWEWRLLALLLALFFLRDFPWRLDEYDQAKQAFTSLEMVQAGDWWFQHTPGGRGVATKPPLVGWISAAVYGVTGSWEWAWRLPSLLGALVLLVLLWREGERLFPGFGGTLAASAFGFNLLTPRLALLVRTDMPLCLWITGIGLIVAHQVRDGTRPWTPRSRWAVFTLLLAAMMTKGPIAYAFLLPGMVAWSFVVHRRGGRWQAIWGGWWHWTLPLLPFLFWLERGMVTMPDFYRTVVVREFLGRFTAGEAAVHHTGPVWSYFLGLLGRWAPWSVLLLAVRFRARRVWWSLCRDDGTLWLVCWFAGGLVLMSLIPSKRIDRVYPVIPPLCLVLTALIAQASRPSADTPPGVAAPGWPLDWAKLALVVAVLIPFADGVKGLAEVYLHHENAPSQFGRQVREATAGRHLEMVVAKDSVAGEETMLVYLRRTRFLLPGDAALLARAGQLDAVVINERSLDYARGLLGAFDPAQPRATSGGLPGSSHYLFLAQPTVLSPSAPASTPSPAPTPRQKVRPPSTRLP